MRGKGDISRRRHGQQDEGGVVRDMVQAKAAVGIQGMEVEGYC